LQTGILFQTWRPKAHSHSLFCLKVTFCEDLSEWWESIFSFVICVLLKCSVQFLCWFGCLLHVCFSVSPRQQFHSLFRHLD
jgi:hypothetical protein